MNELRSLPKTIDSLYTRIIDFYDADVFLLCQHQFPDDNQRVALFNRKVKHAEVYEKPDPVKFFGEHSNLCLPSGYNNWKYPISLQLYMNAYKMSDIVRTIVHEYDYFIIVRCDTEILFDFPPPSLFEKIPPKIYAFDPAYSRGWGGSACANFIHSSFVVDYLSCTYNVITQSKYRESLNNAIIQITHFNQENFGRFCLRLILNIDFTFIPVVNYFFTATNVTDYTTWAKIIIHPTRNVICKYPEQVDEAYAALELWNKGYRWDYKDGVLSLYDTSL